MKRDERREERRDKGIFDVSPRRVVRRVEIGKLFPSALFDKETRVFLVLSCAGSVFERIPRALDCSERREAGRSWAKRGIIP